METLAAVTAGGVRLALRRFAPRGSGRGAVLATHAMMADGRYLHGCAAALAAAGLEVLVLDWRGHGASKPPDPRRDRWSFDDHVTADLPAALAEVERATGCGPGQVAVLGHSLGGLVTLAALGTGVVRVRRLVLAATSVWLPGPGGPRARRAIMGAYGLVARALGYAPIRRLRLGSEDEQVGYVAQLTGWARTGQWTSTAGVDYLAALRRIETPAWALVGAGDRLCGRDDAEVLRARLRGAAPLRVVGRAAGDAFDPDHFTLFTKPAMAPVWDEIATHLR